MWPDALDRGRAGSIHFVTPQVIEVLPAASESVVTGRSWPRIILGLESDMATGEMACGTRFVAETDM